MAEKMNADTRHHLSVNPSYQISKEMQGSDNPIPLSPQWLLAKPAVTGEPHYAPSPSRSDVLKSSGNSEEFHEAEKKRDFFRPSLHDVETGCRDRWRDEERDTNSAIRRDRWRDGDKDLSDARKMERWTDNSSTRYSNEARRVPPERWSDSGNKESNHDQRRESKWNTRWGPDDKESESWREKWSDSIRDGDGPCDKGKFSLSNQGKDVDREGDHYPRSWRSNSFQSRGKGEPPHHQTMTPNKQASVFGYGRGRGENAASSFSAGRGKFGSSGSSTSSCFSISHALGTIPGMSDSAHGDPSTLRYSRTKLLDLYRMTDGRTYRKPLDGLIEVPSLTLAEPLEPLALSAPTPEESVILLGIDKGDIVSSGVPQVSKESSVGRSTTDVAQSRRARFGSREDLPSSMEDYKHESNSTKGDQFNYSQSPSYEKHIYPYDPNSKVETVQNLQFHQDNRFNVEALRTEGISNKKVGEAVNIEVSIKESSSSNSGNSCRSQSMEERFHGSSHDQKDFSSEVRLRPSDMGWPHSQKDQKMQWENNSTLSSSHYKNEPSWQIGKGFHSDKGRDLNMKRQSSEVLDREREPNVMLGRDDAFISRDNVDARKFLPQPSPEDLSLYYKDPQGAIQGPFSGGDLIGWFEAGYFGIDLQVRLASASADTPFLSLGDAMPHLRMKAKPPPGFGVPKQSDNVEALSRETLSNHGHLNRLSELEPIKNEQRNRHEPRTEAENRFLESLMSENMTSSMETLTSTEGMQGYVGNGSGVIPSVVEGGNDLNFLLAQRMSLERPRPLPNSLPYWAGRDSASMIPETDIVPDSPTPHLKLLPQMADSRHHIPQPPQHVDLLSILQGVADNSSSAVVNNGAAGWSNFPDVRSVSNTVQGGMDIHQDKMGMHRNQHFVPHAGYGIQNQRLQPLHQPSLSHIITQPVDHHPSGIVSPEKIFSSGISQDPQVLSMLEQQYLLSQLQLHPQVPVPTQLSFLDKLLIFKQQQKQKQQQLLLYQQQQHLRSQVLSESQSHQSFGEPSHGPLQAVMTTGNVPLNHVGLWTPHEAFLINPQMSGFNLQDGHTLNNITNITSLVPQDVGYNINSEASRPHLPHQIFGNIAHSKGLGATPLQHIEDIQHTNTSPIPSMADSLPSSEVMEKSSHELLVPQKHVPVLDSFAVTSQVHASQSMTKCNESIALVPSEGMVSFVSSEEGPDIPVSLCCAWTGKGNAYTPEKSNPMSITSGGILEESEMQREQVHVESPMAYEVKSVEGHDGKKASEKKTRKQKSKAQVSSDQGKEASKTIPPHQPKEEFRIEGTNGGDIKSEAHVDVGETLYGSSPVETLGSQQVDPLLFMSNSSNEVESSVGNAGSGEAEPVLQYITPTLSGHGAWKPAPGLKAKSLLEIQQEEQQRAQTEMVVSEVAPLVNLASFSSSIPWAGVVANLETKASRDIHRDADSAQFILGSSENTQNLKSKKSQLHDLLAEEILAKPNEREMEVPVSSDKVSLLPQLLVATTQVDVSAVNDDDFVEAKETKKSRKRAAKGKGAGVKASSIVISADLSVSSVPVDKGKTSHQIQVEKEMLPFPPSGPSLGDFVLWKEDQANSPPALAWSTDSGKLLKPTSLRDIQKEQEKKKPSVQHLAPTPTPTPTPTPKVQSNRATHGNSPSWQLSGSSPSKATSPIQNNSLASCAQPKSKTEDDLFWGPLDQSKQQARQSEFPSLANPSSRGSKGTPAKGSSGWSSSRQKSTGSKPAEHSLSSSPASQSSLKGKRDAVSKQKEAMDFRGWCESESFRLIGTKDTSFLEFCLKQSTSEAETLLIENLGSYDPNREFIDKLLNYKELLSADVIEIAFQVLNDEKKVTGFSGVDVGADNVGAGDLDLESMASVDGLTTKGGGKKKGKKGQKVSPSVLGFNVVSNRIMMGEIQSIED